jgi:hypothetical protein
MNPGGYKEENSGGGGTGSTAMIKNSNPSNMHNANQPIPLTNYKIKMMAEN